MKDKFKEWLRRYVPLEIGAIMALFIGGFGTHALTDNATVIAFAAAWSENIGFYIAAFAQALVARQRNSDGTPQTMLKRIFRIPQNMVFEFGVAELLDSFLVRPFCMYILPNILGNLAIGLIIGKILADCFFYSVAILFYEIKKRQT